MPIYSDIDWPLSSQMFIAKPSLVRYQGNDGDDVAIRGHRPIIKDSEACVNEGFRFSTRLHILLWADERGR